MVATGESHSVREFVEKAFAAVGSEITGPAVVVDAGSTTWIDSAARAWVHESGTLVIER